MEETRVSKYEDYRNSFIKQGSEEFVSISKKNSNDEINIKNTTSTLPIKEVMMSIDENEKKYAFLERKKILRIIKISLLILVFLSLIAAVIILGILGWSK